jgi:hypothetical protein
MYLRLMLAAALVAAVLLNSGCSTLADARAARGTGTAMNFASPPDTVWGLLPGVIKEVGLDFVGDNKQEGYLLAQRGINPLSYGEHVAIFVEPLGQTGRTRVEVVSKRAMATNVFAPDWESELLTKLSARLSLVASPNVSTSASPVLPRQIDDLSALPRLSESGKDAYEKFLATKRRPRAFAISDKGGWAWKTGPNAAQQALDGCHSLNNKCWLYAVDNEIVWDPTANSQANARHTQAPPVATSFARIDDVAAVPRLSDKGRELYREYLSWQPPKAVAISERGAIARGRNRPDAMAIAVKNCEKFGNPCRLYAVDDTVVWAPAADQQSR